MAAPSKRGGDGNNNDGAESQVDVSTSGTEWEKPDKNLQQ